MQAGSARKRQRSDVSSRAADNRILEKRDATRSIAALLRRRLAADAGLDPASRRSTAYVSLLHFRTRTVSSARVPEQLMKRALS